MKPTIIKQETLIDIGNAIREKTETTELIPTVEMAQRIRDIETLPTDATATEYDLLLGKIAYNNDGRFVGTIETFGGENEDGILLNGDNLVNYLNRTLTIVKYDNVETIYEYAFYQQPLLKKIDFDNVETIYEYAFYQCKSLEIANFPKVEYIYNRVFQGCDSLTNINMPNLKEIGVYAFARCKLGNAIMPNVTSIGEYAFASARIEYAEFPSLKNITKLSFLQCGLQVAKFATAEKIEDEALRGNNKLTDVYLGYNGVVSIGDKVFYSSGEVITVHVRSIYTSSYNNATNWSELISNGQIIIVGDYED